MLYNEHSKAAKDLERRIGKLQEENKDPTLPQSMHNKRPAAPPSAPNPPSSPSAQSRNRMESSQNPVDESFMLLGGQRVGVEPAVIYFCAKVFA